MAQYAGAKRWFTDLLGKLPAPIQVAALRQYFRQAALLLGGID
jgi:hypothetical protein